MPGVRAASLLGGVEPEGSAVVSARIAAAQAIQLARPPGLLNARVGGRVLQEICALEPEVRARAVTLADAEHLSGRGTDRLLRVARTIADLDGVMRVGIPHVDEAARWRSPASRSPLALAS